VSLNNKKISHTYLLLSRYSVPSSKFGWGIKLMSQPFPPKLRVNGYWSVKLTTHLHLVPRLMHEDISPLLNMSSWHGTWLSTGTTSPYLLLGPFLPKT